MDRNYFWKKIMDWYNYNKRNFLWRDTDNPYYVLVAEILLQQTNAEKVEPAYLEIIKRYPVVNKLAKADLSKLEKIIKPLGLVYRAENLKKCAKIIEDKYSDNFPNKKDELKELPGVGDYISDAVLCYAFDKEVIPIDTNFLRLFKRLNNLKSSYSNKKNDEQLLARIRSFYEFGDYTKEYKFKEYNFAILDFSGKICKSRKPKCNKCCLKEKCSYFKPS